MSQDTCDSSPCGNGASLPLLEAGFPEWRIYSCLEYEPQCPWLSHELVLVSRAHLLLGQFLLLKAHCWAVLVVISQNWSVLSDLHLHHVFCESICVYLCNLGGSGGERENLMDGSLSKYLNFGWDQSQDTIIPVSHVSGRSIIAWAISVAPRIYTKRKLRTGARAKNQI